MTAMLIHDHHEVGTHKGAANRFHMYYVKTGVFTENERLIIYMVVSTTEIKRAVDIIKELDPHSFVSVTSLSGVYGNFHMKPIK